MNPLPGETAGMCSGGNFAAGQRTPRQRRDPEFQALVERAVGQTIEPAEVDFHLVDLERERQCLPDGAHQRGAAVAHAELAHLAGRAQFGEGTRDLRRIGQEVGPVELEQVNGFDAEAPERAFHGTHDVFVGKVEAMGVSRLRLVRPADTAFRGDHHLLPPAGMRRERVAENRLASGIAVDVGVVEKGVAGFHGGFHQGDAMADGVVVELGAVPGAGNSHAAVSESGNLQVAAPEGLCFHRWQ